MFPGKIGLLCGKDVNVVEMAHDCCMAVQCSAVVATVSVAVTAHGTVARCRGWPQRNAWGCSANIRNTSLM